MPYIFVDELPEGTEEANVVSREDYDGVVQERDQYATQRDEALGQIEEHDKAKRAAESKYADLILGMGKNQPEPNQTKKEIVEPITSASLFKEVQ
jgi:hypothetical protein